MIILQNLGITCFVYYQVVHFYLKVKSIFLSNV